MAAMQDNLFPFLRLCSVLMSVVWFVKASAPWTLYKACEGAGRARLGAVAPAHDDPLLRLLGGRPIRSCCRIAAAAAALRWRAPGVDVGDVGDQRARAAGGAVDAALRLRA